ncbi:MAG TPA: hypothetical protein VF590_00190 [Isosphaeraceae bacterium]
MTRTLSRSRWAWAGVAGAVIAGLGSVASAQDDPIPPPVLPASLAEAPGRDEAIPPPVLRASLEEAPDRDEVIPPPVLPAEVEDAPARGLPDIDAMVPPLETDSTEGPRPNPLRRPVETPLRPEPPGPDPEPRPFPRFGRFLRWPFDPPNGYTGPSSILPRERQSSDDFIPIEDRWRIGFPFWDRYDRGNRLDDDYPYEPGRLIDPFNQNVFKGDYPIIGQHTFLDVTGISNSLFEGRQIPTPASDGFESTARPFEENFFGRPNQFLLQQNFFLVVDLFHGDAGFKPADWRIHITPAFNVNTLAVEELGVVSPNVLAGTQRTREWWTLQEWFGEYKISDTSPYYDFLSIRAGSQPFISDFRGFLFADTNRGVRLFGNRNNNRDQYNLAYFRQLEKDTNSGLNSFNDRDQNLIFANYYRQDFIFPGYQIQFSLNYDNDQPSTKYDKNRFLVRPDPVGIHQPHEINVGYFGFAGDGHIGRYNLTHQFYWAFGRDDNNPIANRAQTINAQFFAIEGSYDRDWARFRTSFLWSSGDHNVNNATATGFDTILDNPNFAGGQFSYFQRQNIPLFGVNLTQRNSLVPDLRSSKIQGQANFVNPGLLLGNLGVDFDLTPKLRMINNANLLWFDQTNVLEQFLFDGHIHRFIGADLSTGFEYRPLVSENLVIMAGVATLIQGEGFRNLYNNVSTGFGNGPNRVDPWVQGFINMILAF